jgi:hypothetical protein
MSLVRSKHVANPPTASLSGARSALKYKLRNSLAVSSPGVTVGNNRRTASAFTRAQNSSTLAFRSLVDASSSASSSPARLRLDTTHAIRVASRVPPPDAAARVASVMDTPNFTTSYDGSLDVACTACDTIVPASSSVVLLPAPASAAAVVLRLHRRLVVVLARVDGDVDVDGDARILLVRQSLARHPNAAVFSPNFYNFTLRVVTRRRTVLDEVVVRVRVARERSTRVDVVVDRHASRPSFARDETVDARRGGDG